MVRNWLTCAASLALVPALFVACGGSNSDDNDSDGAVAPAATAGQESTNSTTATATSAATNPTQAPAASSPATSPNNRTAKEWTHEVCLLANAFGRSAAASGDIIAKTDTSAASAKAVIAAEYTKIAAALKVYVSALEAMPATKDPGGEEFKKAWVAAAALSHTYALENASRINELPDGAAFGPEYHKLVDDSGLDHSDIHLRADIRALGAQYQQTSDDIIDATDNNPVCGDIFGD